MLRLHFGFSRIKYTDNPLAIVPKFGCHLTGMRIYRYIESYLVDIRLVRSDTLEFHN